MYELREKLCEELDRYSRKENLSAGDLDVLHKLASTIKNIDKIMMREGSSADGYSREGYSRDGEWQADMRGSYGREGSYARRGMHYVRGHYRRSGRRVLVLRRRDRRLGQSHRTDARRGR